MSQKINILRGDMLPRKLDLILKSLILRMEICLFLFQKGEDEKKFKKVSSNIYAIFIYRKKHKRYLSSNKKLITGEEGRLLAESILSRTRLYYRYYYKSGDKNGQYKNKRR